MTKKVIQVGIGIIVSIFFFVSPVNAEFTKADQKCMIENVYYEARGVSEKEQIMIIDVVLNRVDSKNFPNKICAVIFQVKPVRQFSWTRNPYPIVEKNTYKEIEALVQKVLNERIVSQSKRSTTALFFEKKVKKCSKNKLCHNFR